MAWMDRDYKYHSKHKSMEDKMAAGAIGRARSYG